MLGIGNEGITLDARLSQRVEESVDRAVAADSSCMNWPRTLSTPEKWVTFAALPAMASS